MDKRKRPGNQSTPSNTPRGIRTGHSMTDQANKVVEPAAKRKPPAAGMGRTKGVPNKATGMAREAIAKLVEGNVDQLQDWLAQIAADEKQGPAVAFKLLMDVMEYHIPKLSRAEHVGEGGGAIDHSLTVQFIGKAS